MILHKARSLLRNSIRPCKRRPLTVLVVLMVLRYVQRHHIATGKRSSITNTLAIRFTGDNDTLTDSKHRPVDIDAIKVKVLKQHAKCESKIRIGSYFQKYHSYGSYYNYFEADKPVERMGSITLATYGHGDDIARYTETLAEQWQGPVSIAVFVTNENFKNIVSLILYLRKCKNSAIREYASFHFIFKESYYPRRTYFKQSIEMTFPVDCKQSTYENVSFSKDAKFSSSIAKNVAKTGSKTELVLNSHISYLPNKRVVKQVLNRLWNSSLHATEGGNRVMFLIPLVRVDSDVEVPTSDQKLEQLMLLHKAKYFIRNICQHWKGILNNIRWNSLTSDSRETETLFRFYGLQLPYVERQCDPLYQTEEAAWHETADAKLKMFQLCMMDYRIELVSDSFFLVHEKDKLLLNSDDLCGLEENTAFNINTISKLKLLHGNWRKCPIETFLSS